MCNKDDAGSRQLSDRQAGQALDWGSNPHRVTKFTGYKDNEIYPGQQLIEYSCEG